MTAKRPLPFDPIDEARRHWEGRWDRGDAMAAATAIMRAQQIVLAAVDEALRPFGLTFARYEALVLLQFSRKGLLPLGKMGERLMIHPTSVTNIVDRLEAQGFLRRVPHPTDRRTTLAEITEGGRSVVDDATKAVTAASFAMDGLTERELEQLIRLLRKLRLSAGDFDPADGAPAG
ncbi:MAG TPA: MarR family transcriptional regulator [Acidimicrobiia bacterium]|nr:MarR family transcriptional regulator [Acidimicrobiia bacterium]